jgi:ParB family chromosome partitioning protein
MPVTAKKGKTSTRGRTAAAEPLLVLLLDVEKIDPSPVNREATLDLAPLVESIRTYGVQMPIRVRPKGERFEIVYGERRWRACKELGHATIPATVEELSDDEAQERRILENTQRQDPHALEEAEAFERLLLMRDRKGKALHTPESIARIAGRSVSHVYNRLKLTALAPELRKAFYAGELSIMGAFIMARGVPTKLQPEAWERMKRYAQQEAYHEELDDEGHLNAGGIQAIIDQDYSSRLDTAPFDLGDAKLVPAVGNCTSCPKRSVNQPTLFAEPDRKDICTDVECWRTKIAAFIEREKKNVLAVGGKVLSDEESRKVFNGGVALPWNSPWLDLDSPCFDHPERLPWRQLLGDLCPPPVLAFTSQARPMLLGNKTHVIETLEKNGIDLGRLRSPPPGKAADATGSDEDLPDARSAVDPRHPEECHAVTDPAEARFAAEIGRVSRQRIMAAIVAAAEATPADDNRFVQLAYETMLHGGYHNSVVDTVKRRIGKVPKGEQPATSLEAHVAGLSPAGVRALLVELCLSRGAYYVMAGDKYPRDLARAIEFYGIDASAIEEAVAEEFTAKRAAVSPG